MQKLSHVAARILATLALAGPAFIGCSDLGDPLEETPIALLPRIEALLPDSGAVGDTFRVVGRDFGDVPGALFLGARRLEATVWADSAVRAVVPDSAVSGSVEVRSETGRSNRLPFRVLGTPPPLPELTRLLPVRTVVGDTVWIDGLSFGSTQGEFRVLFRTPGAEVEAPVVTWSDERISVLVPEGAAPGDVRIGRREQRSKGLAFDVAPTLVSFGEDLGFIFGRQGCTSCHFGAGGANGFSVLTPGDILRGGTHGPGAIPRRGAESLIVRAVRGTAPGVRRMPDGGNPMPADQILLLQDWIDQGMRAN